MRSLLVTTLCLAFTALVGCTTAPKTEAKRDRLMDLSDASLDRFKADDSSVDAFLVHSAGYAVFPHAGKGALVVGGAYGKGIVYQGDHMIGYCDMTQASAGAQVGGQEFSELIVFETPAALDRFKNNDMSLTANASAIAVKSGTASSAKYDNGVAVFVRADKGLMAEGAIAGQRFTYRSSSEVEPDGMKR